MEFKNNELIPMTRRYPKLSGKVLKRDSDITRKLISAWDDDHDPKKILAIYTKEMKNLSDERYWELMRTVWILTGSIDTAPQFRELMQSTRKQRFYFSTPEEAAKLREMPEWFDIYRATNSQEDGGLSWTTKKDYASWYKERYQKRMLLTRLINKSEVFAHIDRNQESEIIIL